MHDHDEHNDRRLRGFASTEASDANLPGIGRTRRFRARPYHRSMDVVTHPHPVQAGASCAAFDPESTHAFDVVATTVVFRIVRDELCIGLPLSRADRDATTRSVPTSAPDAREQDGGLAAAARAAAAKAVHAREIVRIASAGVRAMPSAVPNGRGRLAVVSWAIARPVVAGAGAASTLEADESFVRLSALPTLDAPTRAIISCAFEAFLDATLADALTRRLLPRHVLFRKTDGFCSRSPIESIIGATESSSEPDIPIFVGLLPDPFPLSMLRELYERLLDAPLDRGNFRRQFHEIISLGPIQALPIFERGVPHRAGQLFTFDRNAWMRFATGS